MFVKDHENRYYKRKQKAKRTISNARGLKHKRMQQNVVDLDNVMMLKKK